MGLGFITGKVIAMHELATHGLTVKRLPLVIRGENAPSAAYLEHERYGFNRTKQGQREMVARLFQEYTDREHRPHFLTFPGETWAFETLLAERMDAEFTGLECCWPIAERAMRFMPRPRVTVQPSSCRQFAYRTIDPRVKEAMDYVLHTKFGDVQGLKTGRARVLNMYASAFLDIECGDVEKPSYCRVGRGQWFGRQFRNFTGVWFDFTCGACNEVVDCLLNVNRVCSAMSPAVPLVVTLLLGRDTLALPVAETPVKAREAFALRCLSLNTKRRPELLEAWTYRSESDVTMLNMAFLLHKTEARQ